ncbi:predicted protein [Naegleria gruberi]|uniref:Predicted protein n=1 Tax=Naegleria gruberi TaxID=5762 RepID=D2VE99_NAEGR|nr:uncharacterized protein NAEGRDRAFT_33363 [Naegleria gruberi]EFC44759.1 predicted protein [Naegleria gruberi]|eukprot:XP_002677503.1 predicted protein [Naegleria gruberi strain NEG-M]
MKNQFYLDANYTNLNHGSFGSTPKDVMAANFKYQIDMEEKPDPWFRMTVLPKYDQSRKMLSKIIGSQNDDDVVIVENASVAINAIFRSIPFTKKDKIIYFNTAYGMVQKTIAYIHDFYGTELVEVTFTLEDLQSVESILSKVKEVALANKENTTIAVFSHIVSTPAIVLPVKELVQFFNTLNVPSVIDGAHAIGSIPFNVTEIGSDYYLSNAHKWLFTPKSSCVLWKNPNARFQIHPTVISYGYTTTPVQSYQKEFSYVGTRDYSAYLSIKDAIEWRQRVCGGEENIMKYNTELAIKIGELYSQIFGTHLLTEDKRLWSGSMANIRLPFTDNMDFWYKVNQIIYEKFNSFPIFFEFDKKAYIRVSAQIYNSIEDYQKIGLAIYETAKQLFNEQK